ncbi:MAG TPA: ssl1498 family light-harvesting-like protein [Oscillatoriales bacterium UBA8482]|nr:ssl1498 family light-harvesting-like protein [Oscillatoriales bacterium UBA8482]
MPYINEEGGRLNNFAVEPKVYTAEPPSNSQKRNYIIGGIAGMLLVGGLLFLAFTVS